MSQEFNFSKWDSLKDNPEWVSFWDEYYLYNPDKIEKVGPRFEPSKIFKLYPGGGIDLESFFNKTFGLYDNRNSSIDSVQSLDEIRLKWDYMREQDSEWFCFWGDFYKYNSNRTVGPLCKPIYNSIFSDVYKKSIDIFNKKDIHYGYILKTYTEDLLADKIGSIFSGLLYGCIPDKSKIVEDIMDIKTTAKIIQG